ncbi:hypothetical protein HY642_06815, partial [Candidatus Woesearchaeota archaeon]|nr:hypothetical protein [Candidatus Woesearchaeota archaeon]
MKKGQMTVFIIIGIVMLIFAGIVLFIASKRAPPVEVGLDAAANSVSAYVSDCLSVETKPLLKQLSLQGGLLAPKSGIFYNKTELTAYCTSREEGCVNELLTRSVIEAEINSALKNKVLGCLKDFEQFSKRGVRVEAGTLAIKSTVRDDDVILQADLPLTITLGNQSVTRTTFTATAVSNFGLLHAAAVDIANQDISGFFDKTAWATSRQGFVVERHKPYPNTIYRVELKKQEEIDVFQFALKGRETVGKEPAVDKPSLGCCTVDGLCFKNAPEVTCVGLYTSDPSCTCAANVKEDVTGCCVDAFGECTPTTHEACRGRFKFGDKDCASASCYNLACDSTFNYATNSFTGPSKRHGESWCVFDSMAGRGLDYIGSR